MLWKGEPVGSLLVIYWIQMMIIGLWACVKLAVVGRWRALLYVPIFLLMYLSIVNFFGIVAGAMLDDQMRGTEWHQDFSLWTYWVPALLFFATHGLSFWENLHEFLCDGLCALCVFALTTPLQSDCRTGWFAGQSSEMP
jgi:hypothetical protein